MRGWEGIGRKSGSRVTYWPLTDPFPSPFLPFTSSPYGVSRPSLHLRCSEWNGVGTESEKDFKGNKRPRKLSS